MPDASRPAESFRLQNFVVDPSTGTVRYGEAETQLQPKVMQLLLALAEHPGQVLSKEYLLETVWKGSFVVDGALRRCVFLLRKALTAPEDDTQLLETLPRRGYRLLVSPEPIESTQAPGRPRAFEGNAYLGLRVFSQDQADRFFGRAAAVQQVVQALDEQVADGRGFCVVLGPSGCGKSSLAFAGVVPALRQRAEQNANDRLIVAQLRMSDSPSDPLASLAGSIVEAMAEHIHLDAKAQSIELAQQWRDDEDAAVSSILGLLDSGGDQTSTRLLVVFDQFEELLSEQTTEELRNQVLAVLYPLARSGAVWILATMRSEYYPQFAATETLRFLRGEHGQVDLAFPSATEISDIVREPAARAGLSFDLDERSRPLDQIIIDHAIEQTSSLPLLQFALGELESQSPDRTLRVADYNSLGTLEGCLTGHADRVFNGLPEAAQRALPTVLERMVIADPKNEGRVLKRTVALAEFDGEPAASALVEALIEARLITTLFDPVSGAPSAHFAHEAVLTHWERSRQWALENYADIRFRGWVDDQASRWSQDGRANHYLLNDGKALIEARRLAESSPSLTATTAEFIRHSHRRSSRRDLLRGAATVFLTLLTVFSIAMWRNSVNSRVLAEAAQQRSESISDLVTSLFQFADPGLSGDPKLTALRLLDRARERVMANSSNASAVDQAAMLGKLGETYVLMGQYDVAAELLERAEKLLPLIDRQHPGVAAKVLLELGGLRRTQQDLEQSEDYLKRALALAKRANEPVVAAHALNVQGLIAASRGEPNEAIEYHQRARVALEDADASKLAVFRLRPSILANLASARMALGDLPGAEAAFDSAMALRRDYGLDRMAEHTDLLSNRGMLARMQGDNARAVDFFSQAIELRAQLHGPNHPKIASYFVNRASSEFRLADYAAARRSAAAGIEVVANSEGQPDHVIAILHANLALATWLDDKTLDAAQLAALSPQVPVLVATYGEGHGFVQAVSVADAGLRLARAARPDPALCRALAAAAAALSDGRNGPTPAQKKAASQLESCDARGGESGVP